MVIVLLADVGMVRVVLVGICNDLQLWVDFVLPDSRVLLVQIALQGFASFSQRPTVGVLFFRSKTLANER